MVLLRFSLDVLRAAVVGAGRINDLALENAALRQQLATLKRQGARPVLKPQDRLLWTCLSKLWPRWRQALATLQPATVIRWHGLGWARLWGFKSRRQRRPGRPTIPADHIALISRISQDHPEWGEDKIAHELELKLGVKHSTSTIRKYMVERLTPAKKSQRWLTFVTNHGSEMFAIDFATQYTALFNVVYIFIVMELGSRRIVHINATPKPNLDWVKQQIREATPWGEMPRWFIHDNDGIFGQCGSKQVDNGKSYR